MSRIEQKLAHEIDAIHFSPATLARERKLAEVFRAEHHDLLPPDHVWRTLEARWALDPARFDHYHHQAGRWIQEDWEQRHKILSNPEPPLTGRTKVPPPTPDTPILHATPEPSALVCSMIGNLCLIASFGVYRALGAMRKS